MEAHYSLDEEDTKAYQFIQEALMKNFCDEWGEGDEIVVFLTEASKKKNWWGRSTSPEANFKKGLKDALDAIKEQLQLPIQVKKVEIPEGGNKEEVWEIFNKITDAMEQGDRIIFDITHSFRYLPMLALITLNYANFVKGVKVKKIVYGAMEALGTPSEVRNMPVPERIIPVFDLTPFIHLFDWTNATDNFLETGNAKKMKEVGREQVQSFLSKARGKKSSELEDLLTSLETFSNNAGTCRGFKLRNNVKELLDCLSDTGEVLKELRFFTPILKRIEKRFSKMRVEDEVLFGLDVAAWCKEHGLVQQGFTILRENTIIYVIKKFGGDIWRRRDRERAKDKLNRKMVDRKVRNLWYELKEYRNDINHAGWVETGDRHSSEEFAQKLEEFISRSEEILT